MAESKTQFVMQKIYVKDLSFETPDSPQVFLEKWEPDINLQLGNKAATLNENTYEVILELTVTAKVKDKTAFLVEVHLAGIFYISVYDQDELALLTGSSCPQTLFPFAREVVSDLVTRGGFPQLLLSPINFDVLYRQHLEQSQSSQQGDSKH